MNKPLDRIYIHDLKFRCIIGINDDERREKQDVVVHLTLGANLSAAGRSDDIADTVDYKDLKKRIMTLAETSRFFLVEALAQAIAELCLADVRVQEATVRVEKPTALRFARTVGVEITRGRDA